MIQSLSNPFGPNATRSQGEADVLNRMYQQLQALSMMRTSPGIDFQLSPFGAMLNLNLPKPILARIVAKTNVTAAGDLTEYSALPVTESFENITAEQEHVGTDQANSSLLTAYEIANNHTVPADGTVFVWLFQPAAGGHWFFDYSYQVIFAEIDSGGSGGKYAWHQVFPDEGGTFVAPSDVGYSGTTTVNPLYELNGNTSVSAGTIVRAWRGWNTGRAWVQVIPINRGNGTDVHEKQRLYVHNACAGTFTLTAYDSGGVGATTAAIDFDATAGEIETAIEALANITNVTVTNVSAGVFDVEFMDTTAALKFMEPAFDSLESCQEWLFNTGSSGSSFLALLTGKDYTDTDVDGSGVKFTAYSWVRLDDTDDPDPLTYSETSPTQSGGPCNFPAYHEQENDLPVSLRGQVFVCLDTEGGATNEIQTVSVHHATGGTFTLTFDGQTTGNIAYDATAGTVETALEALSNITNVTVTGTGAPDDPWVITFMDSTDDVPLMTANGTNLTPDGGIWPHSVVRLRKGSGDYYLVEQLPFEDLFERTVDSDADGTIGYQRVFNQDTQTFVRGIEVRIITAD